MNEIALLLRSLTVAAAALPAAASPADPHDALETVHERTSTVSALFGVEPPVLLREGGAPEIPNNPALTDPWFFGLGATFMTSNTQARLSGSLGAGAIIDFEDAFGLAQTEWAPEGLARWRFADRWRLELEGFSLNRTHSRTIDNDITWGDTTIPAGTNVKAKFDVAVVRLSCGYSFFKTQDKELGIGLGFHVTRFSAALDATGYNTDDGKLTAPLPVLSLYGQVALTDEWSLQGRLDALKLAIDPFYGNILSIGVDTLYQPWRHLGFGLGWRTLQIQGGVHATDWDGDLTTNYTGPVIFVSSSF